MHNRVPDQCHIATLQGYVLLSWEVSNDECTSKAVLECCKLQMSELGILQLGISPPFQTVIETMSPQFGNRLTPGSSSEVGDADLQNNPHHYHGSELHQTQRS